MAESFLFSTTDSLLEKLSSSACEQAFRVIGMSDDLQEFIRTLSIVNAALLNAHNQMRNHHLQAWLRQLKHILSDAQNVLDEAVLDYGTTKTKVAAFFSNSNPFAVRYRIRMVREIKEIIKRLYEIAYHHYNFGLKIFDVDMPVVHKREMTHSFVIDSDAIGREHDKEKIIELLMKPSTCDGDLSLPVIPIVGMGGMGKTTLAKLVFHDRRVFPIEDLGLCIP